VANSDDDFDPEEQAAFEAVVVNACNNLVQPAQLGALLADLRESLLEDGIEKRTRMVARTIVRLDHQIEVLRIAALMAQISGGVSEQERAVLEQLREGFNLEEEALAGAMAEAEAVLRAVPDG
jgi:hypothetical protein